MNNLRILKKADGTQVVQYSVETTGVNMNTMKVGKHIQWFDLPIVEENTPVIKKIHYRPYEGHALQYNGNNFLELDRMLKGHVYTIRIKDRESKSIEVEYDHKKYERVTMTVECGQYVTLIIVGDGRRISAMWEDEFNLEFFIVSNLDS